MGRPCASSRVSCPDPRRAIRYGMGVVSMSGEAGDACLRIHRTSTSEAVTAGSRDLDNAKMKARSTLRLRLRLRLSCVRAVWRQSWPMQILVRAWSDPEVKEDSLPPSGQSDPETGRGGGTRSCLGNDRSQQGHRSSAWRRCRHVERFSSSSVARWTGMAG